MNFTDPYHAQTTIEDALSWLHDEDGWTWDDLRDRIEDLIVSMEKEDDAA